MRKGLLALAAISGILSASSIAPFVSNSHSALNKELNKVNRRDRMKRSRSYASYLEDMNNDNLSEEDKSNIEKAKLKQIIKNEKRRKILKNI